MADYDVDPAGVRQVCEATDTERLQFQGFRDTLSGGLDGAGVESSSGVVGGALAEFAGAQAPSLDFAEVRTMACMNAAAEATMAYGRADEEMAATAARAATAVTVPDLPGVP